MATKFQYIIVTDDGEVYGTNDDAYIEYVNNNYGWVTTFTGDIEEVPEDDDFIEEQNRESEEDDDESNYPNRTPDDLNPKLREGK